VVQYAMQCVLQCTWHFLMLTSAFLCVAVRAAVCVAMYGVMALSDADVSTVVYCSTCCSTCCSVRGNCTF